MTICPTCAGKRTIETTVRRIPLGNNKGYALVDEEDYERLSQFKWYLTGSGDRRYAMRSRWDGTRNRTHLMHREILNAPQGMVVDHINGDGLDNRRQNIRICTQQQNRANTKRHKNRHGFKGVIQRPNGRFSARVKVNGRVHYTRTFDTPADAGAAYDDLAKELNGEFAALNFPNEGSL